jgi:hypothetical protein
VLFTGKHTAVFRRATQRHPRAILLPCQGQIDEPALLAKPVDAQSPEPLFEPEFDAAKALRSLDCYSTRTSAGHLPAIDHKKTTTAKDKTPSKDAAA